MLSFIIFFELKKTIFCAIQQPKNFLKTHSCSKKPKKTNSSSFIGEDHQFKQSSSTEYIPIFLNCDHPMLPQTQCTETDYNPNLSSNLYDEGISSLQNDDSFQLELQTAAVNLKSNDSETINSVIEQKQIHKKNPDMQEHIHNVFQNPQTSQGKIRIQETRETSAMSGLISDLSLETYQENSPTKKTDIQKCESKKSIDDFKKKQQNYESEIDLLFHLAKYTNHSLHGLPETTLQLLSPTGTTISLHEIQSNNNSKINEVGNVQKNNSSISIEAKRITKKDDQKEIGIFFKDPQKSDYNHLDIGKEKSLQHNLIEYQSYRNSSCLSAVNIACTNKLENQSAQKPRNKTALKKTKPANSSNSSQLQLQNQSDYIEEKIIAESYANKMHSGSSSTNSRRKVDFDCKEISESTKNICSPKFNKSQAKIATKNSTHSNNSKIKQLKQVSTARKSLKRKSNSEKMKSKPQRKLNPTLLRKNQNSKIKHDSEKSNYRLANTFENPQIFHEFTDTNIDKDPLIQSQIIKRKRNVRNQPELKKDIKVFHMDSTDMHDQNTSSPKNTDDPTELTSYSDVFSLDSEEKDKNQSNLAFFNKKTTTQTSESSSTHRDLTEKDLSKKSTAISAHENQKKDQTIIDFNHCAFSNENHLEQSFLGKIDFYTAYKYDETQNFFKTLSLQNDKNNKNH
ncbi:hypothetical protein EDEG_00243 [Edhazardia aedis USNM 41457]|uniref:Uncharacterized protein n=1 Tax=Edhazardia aedis (strain USNM 41457) TaxID=1003232 RepID=J8ZU10_EDHAE|nr:hypothetical protein EDEG_00243 [Edhazardia aedis USNM 41457]|eukprot:EJW03138.1 hypothetical protein EDEG_00243 [Edhazardia aedis USNM 41457]